MSAVALRTTARAAARIAAILFAATCLLPVTAEAQYFGRNKVQYDSFDFQVLETEHFDIYYYADAEDIIDEAGRMAERWYARISRLLDHQLRGRQPLILYTSHPDFRQTNALFGEIGEGTGGATEALKRRIVLPLAGSLKESDHVLGHELVHAFQFDVTAAPGGGVGFRGPGALVLPLWFIEGMAEYLTSGAEDPNTAMWMRDAAACGCELPTLRDLRNTAEYFPYRWGQAFWAYVAGEYGDEVVGNILKVAGRSGNPEAAIESVLQRPVEAVTAEWHQSILDLYADETRPDFVAARPAPYEADPAAAETGEEADEREGERPEVDEEARREAAADALRDQNRSGRELVSERTSGGSLNVSPSLSPDGGRVAFLSEKTRFSIEMFIADAETGEIQRKLTSTATDPHFESLQFINSSGAWRPDGEAFAFATIVKGTPAITEIDPDDGDQLREIRFEQLGELYTPSYSPDGRRLVFAAVLDGYTDLFVLDLETEELTRLTNDLYSDLQPAWSPDGRTIAFVTDRFGTDLAALTYGEYRIGLIAPDGGEATPLPGFASGKQIDPHWGRTADDLYFVAAPTGASNVYRYDFGEGALFQVTDLYTGVSGITALSPAIAVAASGDRLVYTAYQFGNHDLYTITEPQELAGRPVDATLVDGVPAVLPPADRSESLLGVLLGEPRLGLPDAVTFSRHDYDPGLTLDYVSQPQVGAGVDRFGTTLAGGISMYFSDMLGNRNLSTIANINTGYGSLVRSSTLLGAYENRRTRWNWGVEAGQIPYVTRRIATRRYPPQPELLEQQEILQWQISRQAVGSLHYPFSRAMRWELSAGYQNIDFAFEERTTIFDPATGQPLDEERRDLDAPPSLNLGVGSTAFVYDNTLFGGTGPILGQRYRVELSPRVGSLTYNNILGDFRKYVMPFQPVTLAGRILHFGRYGSDAEDPRLNELYLGYGSLIRGYNDGSFGFEECGEAFNETGACPAFDQLFGSRLALANMELRVPLLGYFGVIESPGVPPLELALFFDAGTAWTQDVDSELFGGDRQVVTSHGIAARLNLLGLLIVELDYVHPNDRPLKGWYWQFNLVPAF